MVNAIPPDWPHRAQSRSIPAAGHDWWLIDTGKEGDLRPVMLMLHGAGGSGHSFRHLIPHLDAYRLIVPDLPGQGLTRTRPGSRFGLDAMAADVSSLCAALGVTPDWIAGHSAGGAIALRLAETLKPQGVIGINAALNKFDGAAGVLFPLMAKALAALPLVPQAVSALWGNPAAVNRLLASTGSEIDPAGRAQYLALVRRATHVNGTLGMMAAWQLDGLMSRLPDLHIPALLIAAEDDRTVPARVSRAAASRMPMAEYDPVRTGGHLIHEVAPADIARRIDSFVASARQPSA